ncbi:MAG: glycoside-pentoside-hexuronide (GPH):cation symporter [Oscillospiraceae bacterium]
MEKQAGRRNTIFFGLGTVGRDAFYTMVSMYLMTYLTEVLNLPNHVMWWMTGVFTVLRVFDAINDPFMGTIVDNTKTRWSKFKPWIAIGGVVGAVLMVLLFSDLGLSGVPYVIVFSVCYVGWDVFYGLNDIAYWSMMPSLTTSQKEREKIGSFAKICASVGMFAVVVAILPITNAMADALYKASLTPQQVEALGAGYAVPSRFLEKSWWILAISISVLMLLFLLFPLFGVKEHQEYYKEEEKTSLRDMLKVLFKNDQLLWVAVSMSLFMIGYTTTTSFGVYFFKYAYGDENMYSIFAIVLAVSQLSAMALFPLFCKLFKRRQLYTVATALVVAGYLLFFFSPMNMLPIGAAGILLFVGQSFITLLMLMFLSDTIEYGQWKMGKRNESITFSVQPLINKLGGAIASGVVGATVIVAGINEASSAADVTAGGILTLKVSMLVLPLVVIVAGYIINIRKFKIDEAFHTKIMEDLKARGDIAEQAGE